MRNAIASLVNLVTLLLGIAIGIVLAPHFERRAEAEGQQQPQSASPSPPSGMTATTEQVTPVMTVGSSGTYLLLAHHIQSDELVVGGLDMRKLHEGELNLLSRLAGPAGGMEVGNIINNARDTHLYQVAPKPVTGLQSTPQK